MKITIAGAGAKHELEITPEETMRSIKARLEPLAGMASAEMKLLVKGKAPPDDVSVVTLGLSDGAKLMLMKSQQGAKKNEAPKAAGAVPHWLKVGAAVDYVDGDGSKHPAVVKAVHTDDPPKLYVTVALESGGAERQTPADRVFPADKAAPASSATSSTEILEAGSGPVTLTVSQGRRQFTLRCEASATMADLKQLLGPLTSAESATMKLLCKGKEAVDASTVDALGLAAGGRLMLLFRARHHKQQEGAAAVASCAELLRDVRGRIERTRHAITKRLLSGGEALAALREAAAGRDSDGASADDRSCVLSDGLDTAPAHC